VTTTDNSCRTTALALTRATLIDASECALVYGAAANVLAFVVPLLHRSIDASLAFSVLTQLLVLAAALIVGAAASCGLHLTRRLSGSTAEWSSVHRQMGAGALATVGLVMGCALHELALIAAAVVVFVLLIASASVARAGANRVVNHGAVNWSAAGLLAVVPFLAQPRSERGWPLMLAIAAAAGVVALAFWPVFFSRRPSHTQGRLGPLRAGALALLCVAGCVPGLLAEEPEPVLGAGAGSPPVSSHRPNVIVITLDTVRADHLSLYGYGPDTTPNLRRWWQQGATRYTQAFATSDMTLASHASIFTGLLPSEHGAHRRGSRPDTGLRPSADTLAARLHQAGFVTAGVAANNAYLSPRFGFGAGFDYYDARRPPRLTAPSPSYFFGGALLYWLLAYAGPDFQGSYRSASAVTEQALHLVPRLKTTGRPFFLFMNLMDAHTPMVAPPAFRHAFGVHDEGFYWVREYPELVKEVNSGTRTITRKERRNLVANYDAAIAYLDAELGRFLTGLANLGVLENSLVVITSDHGELFGRSGAVGHDGVGILPGVFHVPLLIRYPGSHTAADDHRSVSAIDLYPTILDVCGLSGRVSRYARALQTPSAWPQRPVLLESFESAWLAALHPRFRGDQRGVLIDGQLIRVGREGQRMLATWTPTRAGAATADALSPGVVEQAVAALRDLEEAAEFDQGTPPQDDGLDRLRSLGYVMQ